MKTLNEKRYEKKIEHSYRVRSDHPRTVRLAALGFLPLMIFGVGCFVTLALVQIHELWLAAGFVLSIAAAIGWMFFALLHGKRHFEISAPQSRDLKGPEKEYNNG